MGCRQSYQPFGYGFSEDLPGVKKNFKKAYAMGRKIGSGAFAQVRICHHIPTGTDRIVKIISEDSHLEAFAREVTTSRIVGQGHCPNVVTFYEYFADSQFLYSVMEYCRGEDLLSYVARCEKPIPDDILANWMKQILTAAAYIHSLGIVHRDLKPANIMFSDDNHTVLKIIDFGSAALMRKGQLLRGAYGDPQFLAPEMILGRYGRKSDIWAIGVICYLLLYGGLPFQANDDTEMFRKIVSTEPSFSFQDLGHNGPSELAIDFCGLLLSKNSRWRPTALAALEHPWITRKGRTLFPTMPSITLIPADLDDAETENKIETSQNLSCVTLESSNEINEESSASGASSNRYQPRILQRTRHSMTGRCSSQDISSDPKAFRTSSDASDATQASTLTTLSESTTVASTSNCWNPAFLESAYLE